jgi:hypothetical protein
MANEEGGGTLGSGNLIPVVGVSGENHKGAGGYFEGTSNPLVDESSDAGVMANNKHRVFVRGTGSHEHLSDAVVACGIELFGELQGGFGCGGASYECGSEMGADGCGGEYPLDGDAGQL